MKFDYKFNGVEKSKTVEEKEKLLFQIAVIGYRLFHARGMLQSVTLAIICGAVACSSVNAIAEPKELCWPAESSATRPWAFWHWMGNAVDKTNITSQLATLKQAGIGGVLIVHPQDCYDTNAVKIPYLSPMWVDIMKHTINQARGLGMDVDMSPGTGWEWGGPRVKAADAASKIDVKTYTLAAGARLTSAVYKSRNDLQAVMGFSADGLKQDLIANVDTNCNLNWTAPSGNGTWTIYAVTISRGSCDVRYPTPDGGGWVMDYLSTSGTQHHLDTFSEAFKAFGTNDWPRSWYDDSWEAYMDWTQNGFDEFQARRGYDLRQYLPEFLGKGTSDDNLRVMRDYRLTIGEMMLDGFYNTATKWGRKHNTKLSGQVIYHPGNEVDFAAASDIPQPDLGYGRNEFFSKGQYNTTGIYLRNIKVSTSGAHVMGKPLVASETLTGWGFSSGYAYPYFTTPLNDIKAKIDLDMSGGVNNTMFHSITYSPSWARWPGYLLGYETQCGPYNPYWAHFAALNQYISRCQSFLQAGTPAVDVLFYYPFEDQLVKHGRPASPLPGAYFDDSFDYWPVSRELFDSGYDFDYVTDKMLLDSNTVAVSGHELVSPGSVHKAIVVGNCIYMEDATLQRLFKLAEAGATVVFAGDFPSDVPGLFNLKARRKNFAGLIDSFHSAKTTVGTVARMTTGAGQILQGRALADLMKATGISRETMTDSGLRYIRLKDESGWIYFIVNPPGNPKMERWISLGVPGRSAALFDAATGKAGIAGCASQNGRTAVHLQLEPSGSAIVRVFKDEVTGPAWVYQTFGTPIPIHGTWSVDFISGGEKIPTNEQVTALSSWTTWTSSPQINDLKYFSGIARYTISFDRPAGSADEWYIDLGVVKNSARVTLNGKQLETVYGAPNFRVNTRELLKASGNQLEVEVANLALNRIAYLGLNHIRWNVTPGLGPSFPKFKPDFVPLESGLIGPVNLVPSSAKAGSLVPESVDGVK